jgi:hypothetical protein
MTEGRKSGVGKKFGKTKKAFLGPLSAFAFWTIQKVNRSRKTQNPRHLLLLF